LRRFIETIAEALPDDDRSSSSGERIVPVRRQAGGAELHQDWCRGAVRAASARLITV
jgi:hypothetical protein